MVLLPKNDSREQHPSEEWYAFTWI